MIDKLDLIIPATAVTTTALANILQTSAFCSNMPAGWHGGPALDLNRHGVRASLRLNRGLWGDHKLEIQRVSRMNWDDIFETATRLFTLDPLQIKICRIDFAIDVPVPVTWFWNRCFVAHKRTGSAYGEWRRNFGRQVETLYFGRRRDLIRIYDKVAEIRAKHSRSGLPLPENNTVLTRIEHQLIGSRIPDAIARLGSLKEHLADFKPFATIRFQHTTAPYPSFDDYSPADYLTGVGLGRMVEQEGLQSVRLKLNKSGRNAHRMLTRYAAFLPGAAEAVAPDLQSLYLESIARQFGATTATSASTPLPVTNSPRPTSA